MVIRTIFTCVIRFFRSIRAALVSVPSPDTRDVESGAFESFGVAAVEIGRPSAEPNEAPSSSYYMSGRQPSRKVSTVRPVKSRIVDAVLRNVRDKRSSVLKEVIITRSSVLHLPSSVKVEFFPGPTPSSRASISSALKALKTSGERVVKFVLTHPLPQTNRLPRSDHSIEDIIDLFPAPPVHVSIERAHLDFELDLVTSNSAKHLRSKEYRSSLSTSGSLLSVTSDDTTATSPPTTPELAQMTGIISASNGIGMVEFLSAKSQYRLPSLVVSSVESVEFPSAVSPLLQEGDILSAKVPENFTFALTLDCLSSDMTPKGQARNPATSLTAMSQASSEPTRSDREGDIFYQESPPSGKNSRFTALQSNTSTPSSSTGPSAKDPGVENISRTLSPTCNAEFH